MKPLISETSDSRTLEELGRATVQVVHDLKNQLNGLKLYATFLRKRLEKANSPADEQETIAKLIGGLERAAADMNVLVRFGRPLELRLQPRLALAKLVEKLDESGSESISVEVGDEELFVDADPTLLAEALKTVTSSALHRRGKDSLNPVILRMWSDRSSALPAVVVEWLGLAPATVSDPFHSLVGSEGLRMSLAARIIAAHKGQASHEDDRLVVRLPPSS
jgi:light-regulated signal transduction histidine kinase (bacteriophytochrome)